MFVDVRQKRLKQKFLQERAQYGQINFNISPLSGPSLSKISASSSSWSSVFGTGSCVIGTYKYSSLSISFIPSSLAMRPSGLFHSSYAVWPATSSSLFASQSKNSSSESSERDSKLRWLLLSMAPDRLPSRTRRRFMQTLSICSFWCSRHVRGSGNPSETLYKNKKKRERGKWENNGLLAIQRMNKMWIFEVRLSNVCLYCVWFMLIQMSWLPDWLSHNLPTFGQVNSYKSLWLCPFHFFISFDHYYRYLVHRFFHSLDYVRLLCIWSFVEVNKLWHRSISKYPTDYAH